MSFIDDTFSAFAVNGDNVPGVGSHPLPHVGGVRQHVPETCRDEPPRKPSGELDNMRTFTCQAPLSWMPNSFMTYMSARL